MRFSVLSLAILAGLGGQPSLAQVVCNDQSTSTACDSPTQHVTESGEPGWRVGDFALRFAPSFWIP